MYQYQVLSMKNELKADGPKFEACTVTGEFSGIHILGVLKAPVLLTSGSSFVYIDLDDFRASVNDEYYVDTNNKRYYFDQPTNAVGCAIPLYGKRDRLQIIGRNGTYSKVITNLDPCHTVKDGSSYYVLATLRSYSVEEKLQICMQQLRNLSRELKQTIALLEK